MTDPTAPATNPIKALYSTITELADSKKTVYGFAATIVFILLVQYLHWSVEAAGVAVAPIVAAGAGQAHVDAQTAKAQGSGTIKEMAVGQLIDAGGSKPATFETVTPTPG